MIESYKNNRAMLRGIVLCIVSLFISMLITSVKTFKMIGIPDAYTVSLLLSRLSHWACLIIMVRYALKVEKQQFMLWPNREYKSYEMVLHILLLWLIIFTVLIPIGLLLKAYGVNQLSPILKILKSIISQYRLFIPLIVITAGIVEEYLFRGYIQPRLELILKNNFLSILITSLLFAAVHIGYGTIQNVVGPFVIGFIFSLYYWKYRNIYSLMICHILIDWLAMSRL